MYTQTGRRTAAEKLAALRVRACVAREVAKRAAGRAERRAGWRAV